MTHRVKNLKVAIEARIDPEIVGGVSQVYIGLASGLSEIDDGNEEYLFFVYQDASKWLEPYIGGRCRLVQVKRTPLAELKRRFKERFPQITEPWKTVKRLRRSVKFIASSKLRIPVSDGIIEREDVSLIHFPIQTAFLTHLPTIYHPHDLQHVHLPHYFKRDQIEQREQHWGRFCREAAMVAVASNWVKTDLINHFHLDGNKIRVVPLAPPNSKYPIVSEKDLSATREKFQLPKRFLFYPAQTWPHKNHISLIESLSLLARNGCHVSLVCSGRMNEHYSKICTEIKKLGMSHHVMFVGYTDEKTIQCLYSLCQGVVIPTRFEAASFPIWEAFLAGVPVACSNVTSLPEQVGDAALMFDPNDIEGMATAVHSLWNDEKKAKALAQRGRKRVANFTWEHTAKLFRAHYRRLIHGKSTPEDELLMKTALRF